MLLLLFVCVCVFFFLSVFMQQNNFFVRVCFASNWSASGHSHIGSLFRNEEQRKKSAHGVRTYACRETGISPVHDVINLVKMAALTAVFSPL